VGQGLTLAPLIRRLRVGSSWSLHDEQVRIRASMSGAALAAIDREMGEHRIPAQWADGLKKEIADRIAVVASEDEELTPRLDAVNRLRQTAIAAERGELIRLWRANEIGDELMHHLMEMLDYDQARLPRARPAAADEAGERVATAD
jgi:monovalent cation/hydrogen antiporter